MTMHRHAQIQFVRALIFGMAALTTTSCRAEEPQAAATPPPYVAGSVSVDEVCAELIESEVVEAGRNLGVLKFGSEAHKQGVVRLYRAHIAGFTAGLLLAHHESAFDHAVNLLEMSPSDGTSLLRAAVAARFSGRHNLIKSVQNDFAEGVTPVDDVGVVDKFAAIALIDYQLDLSSTRSPAKSCRHYLSQPGFVYEGCLARLEDLALMHEVGELRASGALRHLFATSSEIEGICSVR